MTRQPYPDSLPDLPESLSRASSSTQCPHQAYGWNLDSMGFPSSLRTQKTEFGQRSYDLSKLEVMHDPSRTEPSEVNHLGWTHPG